MARAGARERQNPTPIGAVVRGVSRWIGWLFLGEPVAIQAVFDAAIEVPTRSMGVWRLPAAWLDEPHTPSSKKRNRQRPLIVELPDALFLERKISLPRAPRRKLEKAAELDLIRRAPFKANETYQVVRRLEEASTSENVRLSQFVARRSDLDRIGSILAAKGFLLCRAVLPGHSREVILDRTNEVFPSGRAVARINGLLLLAAVAAIVMAHLQQLGEARTARLAQEAELTRLIADASELRAALSDAAASTNEQLIAYERYLKRVTAAEILHAATQVLPDLAWLTDMSFDHKQVRMRGSVEGAATDLLLEFPEDNVLTSPQLSGSVTRTANGQERFEILAQIREQVE